MLLERGELVRDVHAARGFILSLRLDEAENRLVALSRRGGDAAAMHHLAIVSLVRGLLTDDEEHLDDFFDRSDELNRILKASRDSPWKAYLQAENDLNRSMAHLKMGQHVRGALAARSAYGTFEALVRRHPDFPEAFKGLGILKLSIGALSGTYRRVLGVLGYKGSVEEGLELLGRAYHESEFGREEAGIYLALLTAQVDRSSERPVEILASLRAEQPESPLIAFLHGYMLLHYRRAAEAEAALRPIVGAASDRGIEYARFYLAQSLLVQDRFEEAIPQFERYLEQHEGESLRAQAILGLALSYEMSGRREQALRWYERVDDSRGHENDLAAGREARQRIEHPIEGTAEALLLGRNAFDSGRYERAIQLLMPVAGGQSSTPAQRAEAAYRLGRTYHAVGREDEALAWYAQGAMNVEYVEGRWAPWSHFYRAEILALRGDAPRARDEFERAAAFDHEYDYKNALQSSVRAALERLD